MFCLAIPVIVAKIAGYDPGYAAGLYAGSQTISASMGLATDAINRLGLPPEQTKELLDAMPIAYAVTYIFGTVGSAIILAQLGPKLLGIDLVAACKDYEERLAAARSLAARALSGIASSCAPSRCRSGARSSACAPQMPRRWCPMRASSSSASAATAIIEDATADTVLQEGDIVAIAGPREVLVN